MRSTGKLSPQTVVAVAAVTIVSLYYSLGTLWQDAHTIRLTNYDTFGYFYPNILYALDSLHRGDGVFWNRFQNCGQPFFGVSESAMLYPPQVLFLFLDVPTGMVVFLFLHMAMAGFFAYLLCRELNLGTTGSLCGAFSFQLGGITLMIASWWPTLIAHYVWIPAAMAVCERLIRRPTPGGSVLLGVVLALQFAAGYPPLTFLTYQLIAFRVLWECVTHWSSQTPRTVLAVSAGLVLMPAIAAAQFLPSVEVAQQSLRARRLTTPELLPPTHLDWQEFRAAVGDRRHYGAVFVLAPLILAGLAPMVSASRRKALAYFTMAALYVGLAFEGPLFDLYRELPFGRTFRLPNRFLWLTGFAFSVLTAYGAEALVRDAARFRTKPWFVFLPALAAAGLFFWLSPVGLRSEEWGILAAMLVLCGAATRGPGAARFVAVLLPAVVLWSLFSVSWRPYYRINYAMFTASASTFDFVKERMTPQDRLYQVAKHPDYSMMPKSASLFRVPSIADYETQASARYAGFFSRLNHNRPMKLINDFYYTLDPAPENLPLFNLTAARYVIVDSRRKKFDWPHDASFKLLSEQGKVRIYENVAALPRAFFVPRAQRVEDPARLLERLASRRHDPLRVALVEETFSGIERFNPDATGDVTITGDRSEELVVRVDATEAGYLFVSDQFYPGWRASVNGEPKPILRANYAFRLVPVPAGESTVTFRFEPASVRLGAIISTVSILVLLLFLTVRWRRRARRATSRVRSRPTA